MNFKKLFWAIVPEVVDFLREDPDIKKYERKSLQTLDSAAEDIQDHFLNMVKTMSDKGLDKQAVELIDNLERIVVKLVDTLNSAKSMLK